MGASTQITDVVTRFAPSPTGFLHIGGARTALLNWLYARANGGKFLLRIEDTDRARSTEGAIDAILDGMKWLELGHDGDVVFQFANAARHGEVAHELLTAGHAYRCYATQQELAEMREAQKAAKAPLRYDGRWRDRIANAEEAARPSVIRLKAPQTGSVTISDRVQGDVTVNNAELDDFILLRSDGTPTYMLSVVVDDHDMGVSHVIRGDDHLNNAFRQLALIRAMNWPEPVYAHVPLIHGSDGAKLSKRHGALGVDAYRDEFGYLAEAVNNYLLRLGWGHGDDEIISRAQAVEWFNIDDVGRSPSRFDFKKLGNLNAHYLREAEDDRLTALLATRLGGFDADQSALITRAMPVLKPRSATLVELAQAVQFLIERSPISLDEKAQSLLDGAALVLLEKAQDAMANLPEWEMVGLEEAVRVVAQEAEVGLGKVAQPLRAALTGRGTSPGIFDVLMLLGREESLARIRNCLAG